MVFKFASSESGVAPATKVFTGINSGIIIMFGKERHKESLSIKACAS